jgi:hypothetical protein
LAAIDLSIGEVSDWNPQIELAYLGRVLTMCIVENTLYFGGQINKVGEEIRKGAAAVDLLTANLKSWELNIDEIRKITGIVHHLGDMYVSGNFRDTEFQHHSLAKVNLQTGNLVKYIFSIQDLYFGADVEKMVSAGNLLFVKSIGTYHTRVTAVQSDTILWNKSLNMIAQFEEMVYNNGIVYASGRSIETYDGNSVGNCLAFNATTGNLIDWHSNPKSAIDYAVYTISANGNKIFIGGRFRLVNATFRPGLLMYNLKTQKLLPYSTALGQYDQVEAMKIAGNILYAGGSFINLNRPNVAAFDINSGELLDWQPISNISSRIRSLEADNDNVYVGGQFTVSGTSQNNLIAISRFNGNINPWAPNPSASVNTLFINDGMLYAGGGFMSIAGQSRRFMSSFELGSLALRDWNPNLNGGGGVNALHVKNKKVYMGGTIYKVGEAISYNFAVVDTDSAKLIPNYQQLNWIGGTVSSIEVKGRYAFVGGNFSYGEGRNCKNIAQINLKEDGEAPKGNFCLYIDENIWSLASTDDRLFFSGQFIQVNQKTEPRVGQINFPKGYFYEDYIYRPVNPFYRTNDQANKAILLQPGTLIEAEELGSYLGEIVKD